MTFAYPFLLAAPLIVVALLIITRTTRRQTIPAPSASFLQSLPMSLKQRIRTPLMLALLLATSAFLAVAAARPQRISVIESKIHGRNIMLVVDVSRSMAERDFPAGITFISRLDGLKTVVSEYVKDRSQDRIGLVVFGQAAFLQSPLTTDTSIVEQFVKTLWPRMAGDGTAIGDGLGLALKRLRKTTEGSRAIILMTDGVNTAGQVSPLKAAQVAKELGVQIHTIGIGGGDLSSAAGLGDIFSLGAGRHSEFDDDTLKKIASLTGGVYFNASSLADFQAVYQQLEKLTTTESDQPAMRHIDELFFPWALAGLTSFALLVLLNFSLLMRVP